MAGLLSSFAPAADAPPVAAGAVDGLYRRHRLWIMVAITAGYGMSYTCRLGLGVVKKPLIDAGVFSATDLGLIGSALFYTYAFGKLTNGFLADHTSARKFFALGILLSAICNLAMGFTGTSVAIAALIWGLNGWFQSFGAPSSVVALAQWFSNRERGTFYGIWCTSHSVGESGTFLVVGAAVAALGWRYGFYTAALIGLVASIGVFFLMQDRPQTLGLPAVADWKNDHWNGPAKTDAPVFLTQLSILKIPAIWVLAISSALAYVTRYAINSWGVLYLQEARGYSLGGASSMIAVSTIAGIVGAVAFGYISDKVFASRRPPANLIFGMMELIGLGLIFFGPSSNIVLIAGMIFFGLGMTGLFTSIGGLFATDIAPKRAAGAALGMIGVFSYLGAAIQENVSGHLIGQGTTIVNGVRHYDFGPAILVWIGASAVSMLLAASLWRVKFRD